LPHTPISSLFTYFYRSKRKLEIGGDEEGS
jgi:hypothetical protein